MGIDCSARPPQHQLCRSFLTICPATWYVANEFTWTFLFIFQQLPFNGTTSFLSPSFHPQDQISELHKAAARGSMREFQQLLDRPSLVQSRDPLGATVLHKAVLYGHYDLAEYIASNYGTTALDAKDNVSLISCSLFYFFVCLWQLSFWSRRRSGCQNGWDCWWSRLMVFVQSGGLSCVLWILW